ncbi:response regulator [Roseobacter sp. HKCCA0434]|uniref:response regulator n=1 Tax=Roseobacter sp. HKCCA0434 TaxID=3079297 RepID=UPI002905B267|nr:response regulator [Roseobacter sp. HKCCA0434]
MMIMEDDLALAAEWQIAFEEAGMRVVQTHNASDCLDWLARNEAHTVIADIYIRRDGALISDGGVKLVGMLRSAGTRAERPDLPIVAITGASGGRGAPVLELASAMGADLVLRKPVPIPDLIAKVEGLMRLREQEREQSA